MENEVTTIPVFCSNIRCGKTWRTRNRRRVGKCFKCGSKGKLHGQTNSTDSQTVTIVEVKTPQEIRQEKLAELKKKLEADDDFEKSTFEKKTLRRKIRELESYKFYAAYVCHNCGIDWTSIHGWTSFTQKCVRCGHLADCLGPVELSDAEIQAKMQRSLNRAKGFHGQKGSIRYGHDPRRCQMCAMFIGSGHTNCMKKKWARLQQEGTTFKILQSY